MVMSHNHLPNGFVCLIGLFYCAIKLIKSITIINHNRRAGYGSMYGWKVTWLCTFRLISFQLYFR